MVSKRWATTSNPKMAPSHHLVTFAHIAHVDNFYHRYIAEISTSPTKNPEPEWPFPAHHFGQIVVAGMSAEERVQVVTACSPELASFNAGSLNFGIFPLAKKPSLSAVSPSVKKPKR